jgi:hypothetical protein
MSVFQVFALLLTPTALFSYLNYRFIKLPTTIGVMLIALIASLGLIALQHFGFNIAPMAARVLQSVDFSQTLLQGMLSFLLSAGAPVPEHTNCVLKSLIHSGAGLDLCRDYWELEAWKLGFVAGTATNTSQTAAGITRQTAGKQRARN